MSDAGSSFPDADGQTLLEGFARVVAVEGGRAWLEPEETTSCGTCHSAGLCSIGKDAGNAKRMAAKRFQLPGDLGLKVGERVVVGISETALVKGAATAYGLPLIALLAGGILGQEFYATDGMAALGAFGGLVVGLGLARLLADGLSARGVLTPRFLRRDYHLPPDAACTSDHG
ncbi:Fis family transcriptional regulator [Paramagnetospirillum kuznetsovii]|uniref:Fis family transcriptional regulator n=1 Tax=Paramagnetospirillum kuznetsovii TaxID=2053833 RepID=A0A364NWX1_9PROT|nr:SoxR reducing system RseC family protein [Paramagnetospirillum kuznetsovii]RAU21578.1 Fis family transcriptional regulator [Paramagnetospirillum kuznetsovii]